MTKMHPVQCTMITFKSLSQIKIDCTFDLVFRRRIKKPLKNYNGYVFLEKVVLFAKRYYIIDQHLARHFKNNNECLSSPLPF